MRVLRLLAMLVLGLVGLALLWLVVLAGDWLPRLDDQQRAALAILRSPPPLAGDNGWAWLQALRYDIPAQQLPAVLAEPMQALPAPLAARFPALATPDANSFAGCRAWSDSCLDTVRRQPEAARAYLQQYRAFLARRRGLEDFGHIAAPSALAPEQRSPPLGGLGAPIRVQAAVQAVDGDPAGALDTLCRDGAVWRRLLAQSTELPVSMYAISQLATHAGTYARIRAGLDAPPALCPAFAPLAVEQFDQCQWLASELAWNEQLQHQQAAASWPSRIVQNIDHASALYATAAAPFCRAPDIATARSATLRLPRCGSLDWLFDPFGCTVVPTAAAPLSDDRERLLDLDSRLRLVASAAWLAEQPRGDWPARFAARPAALHDDAHALELDARCAPALSTRERAPASRGAGRWQIPLPVPADCVAGD